MIVSTTFLNNAYNKYKKEYDTEHFSWDAASSGANSSFVIFILVVAIIFFVLEVLLLVYSLYIAIKCTKGGPERIVHVVLATFFTMPYALLNALFNKCAISTLRGE